MRNLNQAQNRKCARTSSGSVDSSTQIQAQDAEIVPRIRRNLYPSSMYSGVICWRAIVDMIRRFDRIEWMGDDTLSNPFHSPIHPSISSIPSTHLAPKKSDSARAFAEQRVAANNENITKIPRYLPRDIQGFIACVLKKHWPPFRRSLREPKSNTLHSHRWIASFQAIRSDAQCRESTATSQTLLTVSERQYDVVHSATR